MQTSSLIEIDLDTIGDDIVILTPINGTLKTVMKFGGSSLANAERLTYVAKLIKKHVEAGYKPIIVCSAMGKTTNALISAGDNALNIGEIHIETIKTLHLITIEQLHLTSTKTFVDINILLNELEKLLEGIKNIGELTPRTKDSLVSFGERMSVKIMSGLLNKYGIHSQSFDSRQLGLVTTSDFGNAEVKDESYANIKAALDGIDSAIVPIVTGICLIYIVVYISLILKYTPLTYIHNRVYWT